MQNPGSLMYTIDIEINRFFLICQGFYIKNDYTGSSWVKNVQPTSDLVAYFLLFGFPIHYQPKWERSGSNLQETLELY